MCARAAPPPPRLHLCRLQLVAAFRATLEEIKDASLLLHVVDASHPNAPAQARGAQQEPAAAACRLAAAAAPRGGAAAARLPKLAAAGAARPAGPPPLCTPAEPCRGSHCLLPASPPACPQIDAVNGVLEELGVKNIPTINVWNKVGLI